MSNTTFFGNHLLVRYTFMATHGFLALLNLVLTLAGTHDIFIISFQAFALLVVLVYAVPATLLCRKNQESGYERGWVEMFYLTFQTLLSWVSIIWLAFMYHPWLCDASRSNPTGGILPLYYPWGQSTYDTDYNTRTVCSWIAVSLAFGALYSLVLMIWFGWTLWLTTKVAKTMGEPWTRDLVLKKVSMGKMSKLHQWREGEQIGMGKVVSRTGEE